ncbi:MerR family transcriptional regulator [Bacteroidia bacterium]|jgi:DNA-binding transcriptional MerR regulator|nr:MerR family transcriptional regulator [Bacteroidia bacterium]
MDEPQEKLYFNLTEVCSQFDIQPSTLRYWESEFNTLNPKRNKRGVRFYTKKDIEEVKRIHLLVKTNKYTIKGAIEKLKKDKANIDHQEKLIHKLEKIKQFLIQIKQEL